MSASRPVNARSRRHLHAGIDAERTREALGDDRGHVGLRETLKQQIRLVRVYHRIDGREALVTWTMQSSIHG